MLTSTPEGTTMYLKIDAAVLGLYQKIVDAFQLDVQDSVLWCLKAMTIMEAVSLALAFSAEVPTPALLFRGIGDIGYIAITWHCVLSYGATNPVSFRMILLAMVCLVGASVNVPYEFASWLSVLLTTSAYYLACCKTPPPRKKTSSKLSFGV